MLSLFSRKAPTIPKEDRQIRRINVQDGEGVIYASKNTKRGISFSFSGPAGSRHADEALVIAGHVYSNEKDDEKRFKDAKQIRAEKTIKAKDEDEYEDEVEHLPRHISPKRHSKREPRVVESTDNRHRHVLTAEDAQSVFSDAPTEASRKTTTSSRHTTPASLASDAASVAGTYVSSTRHIRPAGAEAWKSETDTQITYGLREEGRKLFVSAPKDSRQGDLLRQVAEKATRGCVRGILYPE